jgi:hypothetical protein
MKSPARNLTVALSFGACLVILGIAGLLLLPPRSPGVAGNDPGPGAFPAALSVLLILGGIYEMAATLVRQRRGVASRASEVETVPADEGMGVSDQPEESGGTRDAIMLLIAVLLYLPAIHWLGFMVSTFLFTAFVMRGLRATWIASLFTGLSLVLVIHFLFVVLFRVQLPVGRIRLLFP